MLNFLTLKSLLETKFSGSRKDGIEAIARAMALTFDTEEAAKAAIEKMTVEDVNATIGEYRKTADTEITKALKTNEESLRAKFDFVEKGAPAPTPTPAPAPTPQPTPQPQTNDLKTLIAEAIKQATGGLQAELQTLKDNAALTARREDLTKELGDDLPASYRTAILDGFNARKFATDDEYNAYKEQIKANVSSFRQEAADKGLQLATNKPGQGNGGKGDQISAGVAEYLKQMQEGKVNTFEGKTI